MGLGLLLLCRLPAGAAANSAAIDFSRIIPPDTTVCFQIADLAQLQEDLLRTGPGKIWADPQVQNFFAPWRKLQADGLENYLNNFKLDRRERERLFNRQLALLIGDVLPLGTGYTFEICLLAQRSGATEEEYKAFIDRLIGVTPERATRQTLNVEDVKIFQIKFNEKVYLINGEVFSPVEFDKQPEDYKQQVIKQEQFFERNIQYAFTGELFLLSDGDDRTLAEIVHLLKKPQSPSMAGDPIFVNTFARHPPAPALRFFLNLKRYNDYLNLREAEFGESNRFKNLGLDQLQGIGATLHQQQDNLQLQGNLFCSATERGVPALLNVFRDNPMRSLKAVPEAAVAYDTMVCDWPKLWQQLFELLEPDTAQLLRQQLDLLKTTVQLDVENEIIRALGREIAVFTLDVGDRAQPAPFQVSMIELKDRAAGENLLRKVLGLGGLGESLQLEEIPFLGLTIQTASDKTGGLTVKQMPYWVFTEQYFILADDPQPLRETILALRGERPAILNNRNFIQSRQLLPPDVSLFGWSDMTAIDTMLQALLKDRTALNLLNSYFSGFLDLNAPPQGPLLSRHLQSLVHGMRFTNHGVEMQLILNGKSAE